jgi:coenzyme F420-reducing hydrogenase alpha subunit
MKTIQVPAMARVEGEGGLFIGLDGGKAVEVRLDIYEPPRFFEGFLKGRFLQEVPDITARICGICPVAYQMSSAMALEAALGVTVSQDVRALRRLMYCGEYVESHALHMYMLQAPDLFGKESAFELAEAEPETVKSALRLKKAGNELLKVIGGRSVHPVNVCVGGFYSWPDEAALRALLPELRWGLGVAIDAVKWSNTLAYPAVRIDYEFVALHDDKEYGLLGGDVLSSAGRRIPVAEFETAYLEKHVRHSNALHGHTVTGGTYLVGPLARLNLNHAQLGAVAKKAIKDAKIELPLTNPYKAFIARAVELVQFLDEAIQILEAYAPSGPAHLDLKLQAGEGCGASEAPRGMLFHKYRIDAGGFIESARIVPPTAQNLPRIEADLLGMAPDLVRMELPDATRRAEDLVRAYDPCISCATHFLKLRVGERTSQ